MYLFYLWKGRFCWVRGSIFYISGGMNSEVNGGMWVTVEVGWCFVWSGAGTAGAYQTGLLLLFVRRNRVAGRSYG